MIVQRHLFNASELKKIIRKKKLNYHIRIFSFSSEGKYTGLQGLAVRFLVSLLLKSISVAAMKFQVYTEVNNTGLSPNSYHKRLIMRNPSFL